MRITGIRYASSLLAALLLGIRALACTTAVVSAGGSASGRPMLWKQRDAGDAYNTIAYVRGEKYGFTALFPTADSQYTKAYAGINEVGFAITNNLSYNLLPEGQGYGDTRNGLLMAEALGRCATVEEFHALLKSRPHPMRLCANFGVIDAEGGAAYFEVSDEKIERFDVPEGGCLFRTNFSLSGESGRGKGYERYATMESLTARKASAGFDAAFFLHAGRSYIRDGKDRLRQCRTSRMTERNFIPRTTTTAGIVIEGVGKGDAAGSGMMWCAVGYTPCCYAVPVWVAAKDDLPALLSADAPANLLAVKLYSALHDGDQVDTKALRLIIRRVEKAERREMSAGQRLDRKWRSSGLDREALLQYNRSAEERFRRFKTGVL